MNAHERIRRCAQAVAGQLGGNHLRYLAVVAVILYCDEAANNVEEWDALADPEFKTAALDGVSELRDGLDRRRRQVAA